MSTLPYDRLAALLRYPDAGLAVDVDLARAALAPIDQDLSARLRPLAEWVRATPVPEREERFTQTFDINPLCTLETGWLLYGEDYNRGAFLVHMRRLMRSLGVEETLELPDHLQHVLPVLGRLAPRTARELCAGYVLPALRKMLEGFRDAGNPYRCVLETIQAFLIGQFGDEEGVPGASAVRAGPYAAVPGGVARSARSRESS